MINLTKVTDQVKEKIDFIENKLNKYGGPFGAIIIDRDYNLIADGWNTVTSTNDPTAHAEINAIRNACHKLNTFDLSGYTLIATGYPCPMCFSAIMWANIKDVYFVSPVSEAERIGFRDEFIYETIEALRSGKNPEVLHIEKLGIDEHEKRMSSLYTKYQECGKMY